MTYYYERDICIVSNLMSFNFKSNHLNENKEAVTIARIASFKRYFYEKVIFYICNNNCFMWFSE